jgi:putative transposase
LLTALIAEAEKLCLHNATVTAFTLRVDTPCTYISAKARESGIIVSQAVLIAVAIDGEGRRQVLGVDLANRESRSSWRDFLSGLKQRGLFGVDFVVSDRDPRDLHSVALNRFCRYPA